MNKKRGEVMYHQHEDGVNIFGRPHPIRAKHENPKTRRAHNKTILIEANRMNEKGKR